MGVPLPISVFLLTFNRRQPIEQVGKYLFYYLINYFLCISLISRGGFFPADGGASSSVKVGVGHGCRWSQTVNRSQTASRMATAKFSIDGSNAKGLYYV